MKVEINEEVYKFIKTFTHISIDGLYEIIEYLNDKEYLSKEGKKFYKQFWEKLIKEEK